MPKREHAPPVRRRVRRGNADDAQRLREELLHAAMQLFVEGGLEAVSVRAVAAHVGVSPMTPYRYFADKAELLVGLWHEVLLDLMAAMRAAVTGRRGSARTRMRALVERFLGYWETHEENFRLVFLTQGLKPDGGPQARLPPVYLEIMALFRQATMAVAEEIGASDKHVTAAEEIRFAMLLGYLQAALVNRRYPFGDRAAFRAGYIEQVLATQERCLLAGPVPAPARAAHAAALPRRQRAA